MKGHTKGNCSTIPSISIKITTISLIKNTTIFHVGKPGLGFG
jgi:hypothetical protein